MRIRERFNPRAPCGARQQFLINLPRTIKISTHAPLAGRDFCSDAVTTHSKVISTHAPLAGRDR